MSNDQPTKKPKKDLRRAVFVLFEGTGNDFKNGDDEKQQLVYYGEGVGMHDFSSHTMSTAGEMGSLAKKAITEGFASSFPEHVLDAYRWLMNVHRKDDEIYVMGFSRGAYAAGCFCGLLETVGLLPRESSQIVSTAWEVYNTHSQVIHKDKLTEPEFNKSFLNTASFRSSFSKSVRVHFLGLWDTVASIGNKFGAPYAFPQHKGSVRHVYHAMALDEQRNSFLIQRWGARQKTMRPPILRTEEVKPQDYILEKEGVKTLQTFVNEVWFPGVHSDVGGGNDNDKLPDLSAEEIEKSYVTKVEISDKETVTYYRDGEMRRPKPSLALISLRWMLRAILWCKSSDIRILIDPRAAARFDLALSYDLRQANVSNERLAAWPAEHLSRFFQLHTRDGDVDEEKELSKRDMKKVELVRKLKQEKKIHSDTGELIDDEHMGFDVDRRLAMLSLAHHAPRAFAPKTEVELSILRIVDAFNVRSSNAAAKGKALAYLMAGFWGARESKLNLLERETNDNLRDILAGDKFHITVKTRMLALRLDDEHLLAASGINDPSAMQMDNATTYPTSLSSQAKIVWGSNEAEETFERLHKGGILMSFFGTKKTNDYLPYSTPPIGKDGKAVKEESWKYTDDQHTRLEYGAKYWNSLLDDSKFKWVE